MRRTSWRAEAVDTPFSTREVLRGRGLRWDQVHRVRSPPVADDAVADEVGWARLMLHGGRREPVTQAVDWTKRCAAPVLPLAAPAVDPLDRQPPPDRIDPGGPEPILEKAWNENKVGTTCLVEEWTMADTRGTSAITVAWHADHRSSEAGAR